MPGSGPAPPRGQAANLAAECLLDLLRELLVGLRDFAAHRLAAAAEIARIHELLRGLSQAIADGGVIVRVVVGSRFCRLGFGNCRRPPTALRRAAEELVDLLLDSAVTAAGRDRIGRLGQLTQFRRQNPDQRDDNEDDQDNQGDWINLPPTGPPGSCRCAFLLFAEAGR